MAPCSRSGAWLAGHRAKLRTKPIRALMSGQRDGGCRRRTTTGSPPLRRTAFCAISASAWRDVMWRRAQIAGSVISSRSPAWITVRTRASIPPTWQTTVLLRWLLHVRFDRIPAAHVTTFTSLEPRSWTSPCNSVSSPSCCNSGQNTEKSSELNY